MSRSCQPSLPLTRREFGRTLVVGTLAVSAGGSSTVAAVAAEPTPAAASRPPAVATRPLPAPLRESEVSLPEETGALLVRVIAAQYPDPRLTPGILSSIRGEVDQDLYRAAVIRNFPLQNSDPPAFHFAAYRKDRTR